MAVKNLSRVRLCLLVANLAGAANIAALHTVIFHYPKVLNEELLYRILLSYLPESLDSKSYSYLIEFLVFNTDVPISENRIDTTALDKISEDEVKKLVGGLRLLPLVWPNTPYNITTDKLTAFLLHRSIRIDESTGLILEIPALLGPFFHCCPFLLSWMVSTILPLIRLSYEYYPDDSRCITIQDFDALDDKTAVSYLLARTSSDKGLESDPHIGRDLRGILGPWLHGEVRQNKLKSVESQSLSSGSYSEPFQVNKKYVPWEESYLWIFNQAEASWKTAVDAIDGWSGPGDYDLGGYSVETPLTEKDQVHLKKRYIRTAFATAYSITEASRAALNGVYRILNRIANFLDAGNFPPMESTYRLLVPTKDIDSGFMGQLSMGHLETLMEDGNPLTAPEDISAKLLHALLISAVLCERLESFITVRYAAMLVNQKEEYLQSLLLSQLMLSIKKNSREEDEYFVNARHELLWLRSWGIEAVRNDKGDMIGIGILGRLSSEFIEVEFLKVLLSIGRSNLAQSLYDGSQIQIIQQDTLHDQVVAAALSQYDNATNANISRGGLKRCNDILKAFPKTFSSSAAYQRMQKLLQLTSDIEPYRLVLKKGEPFRPISLRIHEDPLDFIGKILEQNSKSYTKITDMIQIAKNIAQAGLIKDQNQQRFTERIPNSNDMTDFAERRVISMCIDAALVEDDFETAYSYVVTYIKQLARPTPMSSMNNHALSSQLNTPRNISDDWMWRAALQAGKYYRAAEITNSKDKFDRNHRNHNVRQLKKRMDCITQALKLAPSEALQEILNVYRRCEEELECLTVDEAESPDNVWDHKANNQEQLGDSLINTIKKNNTNATSYQVEEEPITLFDLSRAGMLRAQSGLSAFSILKGKQSNSNNQVASGKNYSIADESDESGTEAVIGNRIRKRDKFKNAAVGGLASGVGWLIGAAAPKDSTNDDR